MLVTQLKGIYIMSSSTYLPLNLLYSVLSKRMKIDVISQHFLGILETSCGPLMCLCSERLCTV